MLGRGKKFEQTGGASGALSNIVHESTNHGADTTLYCIMYKALDEKELAWPLLFPVKVDYCLSL
jgi:hypothetical protein